MPDQLTDYVRRCLVTLLGIAGRAGPDPALVRALAALAGIGDPDALAGELALAWDAAREHRLTLERGRGRIRRCGNSNVNRPGFCRGSIERTIGSWQEGLRTRRR